MLNELMTITKFLQDTLKVAPYNFSGDIRIDHALYIDQDEELPVILVNDVVWTWGHEQYGSAQRSMIQPLNIEIFTGSKLEAIKITEWIIGKRYRGVTGFLFNTNIPLKDFEEDGHTVIGDIGIIKFGDDPLPTVRFDTSVDTAELAFHYTVECQNVEIVLDKQ